MAAKRDTGWVIVSDQDGQPYWERRIGDALATVRRTQMNGAPVWYYRANFDQWFMHGYKDTFRSAKIEATKALRWYALREADFKRVKAKLRLLWLEQGIESVEPVPGTAWDERADQVPVYGILWKWDRELCMWMSGAWRLWYNRNTGWMLRYPDDYIQELHVDNRYDAMREAAMWIGLALEE
jgi:hypothetical protein